MRTSATGCCELALIASTPRNGPVPSLGPCSKRVGFFQGKPASPSNRPRPRPRRRQRALGGFTLLEMLVALVIIGVAVSTVVIVLQPDHRAAVQEEAKRLAALLELASEEATLMGTPMAWVGLAGGYEFQARELTERGPDWGVVRGDDLLHPRSLPAGIYILNIQADGQALALGERVLLGLQGVHALRVELALGNARALVSGSAGRFQLDLTAEAGS